MTVCMIECLVCHSLIKQVSLRSDGWQGRAGPCVMAALHVCKPIHNTGHSLSSAHIPFAEPTKKLHCTFVQFVKRALIVFLFLMALSEQAIPNG